jgi:hypothetical protein
LSFLDSESLGNRTPPGVTRLCSGPFTKFTSDHKKRRFVQNRTTIFSARSRLFRTTLVLAKSRMGTLSILMSINEKQCGAQGSSSVVIDLHPEEEGQYDEDS